MSSSPFVFEIGADVTKFTKSIGEVEDELKRLKDVLKTQTGSAISETNKQINELQKSLVNLKKLGLESTQSFGKASTNALTSLSLAIQDVSFGFIGIQNNLPGIVQGFSQMNTNAQTGATIMSQLGAALIGPAGLYLAFSAVTAIVTKITLEYGSLGAALDALFNKQTKFNEVIKRANESFKEYSKSILTNNEINGQASASQNGQALAARALLATILNLSKTEAERKKALDALKKLDEERFKNFDIEKGKIDGLKQAVEGYTRALIAQSVANKFVDQVSSTSVELEKQRNALQELYDQIDLLEKTYPNLAYEAEKYKNEVIDSQGRLGAGMVNPTKGVIDYISTLKKIGEQEGSIKVLVKQLEDLNTATLKAVQSASKLASPPKPVKEKKEKVEGLGKIVYGAEVESRDADMSLDFINKLILVNLKKAWGKNGIFNTVLNRLLEERKNLLKKKLEEEAAILAPKKVGKIAGAPLSAELEAQLGAYQVYLAKLQEVQALLSSTFLQPLENAFMNLFETGKFGFKAFADAVLKQIQQLVAKIIATGIISLIANLASGGFAGVGGAAKGFGAVGQSILSAIGLGVKKTANPSFGGVGPGSMGMSGQVNVVLRGSDLVGALNRTNATINRVG
jgi:hypothetical protein